MCRIFRPCRGLLAERSHPLGRGYSLWRRFFLCIGNRTSNLFVTGRFRKILVEKNIRDMVTRFVHNFSFAQWMSLWFRQCGIKHEGMIWSERWGPEHLLRTESGDLKVGFMVQQLHGPEILRVKNIDEFRSLRAHV